MMKRYPDPQNNPNGDPRISQQQYEEWWREQEEYRKQQEASTTPFSRPSKTGD